MQLLDLLGSPLLSLRVPTNRDEAIPAGLLWIEIATHLSGGRNDKTRRARNDSGKQPDESGNYKDLEVEGFKNARK